MKQAKKEGANNMKTYYIYKAEAEDDTYIGKVEAMDIIDAELRAYRELKPDCEIYALSTAPGEPWK